MGATSSTTEGNRLDTIPKLVQHWSHQKPEREFFVFYNGDHQRDSYTFRQVLHLAGLFSKRLKDEYCLQKGDIVANTLPNSPERVVTDLGIILAGCVCLNAATMFSDGSDFLTSANNSGLRAVIVYPHQDSLAWKILESFTVGDVSSPTALLACDKAPLMKTAILVSRQPTILIRHFLQELSESQETFVEADIQPEDNVYVFTTSGTTGYCKLVPRTHAEIIEIWSDVCRKIDQQHNPVWRNCVVYNDRPIGWTGGFPFGSYVCGDTRVLLDVFETQGSKTGADTWKIICQEQVDWAIVMPIDLDNMFNHSSFEGMANYKMKLIGCGGQPMRKDQLLNYYKIADEVCVLYGSTEAGFLSFGLVDRNEVRDYFSGQVKPGVDVKIVDNNNIECQADEVGTIYVKGRGVFKGYLNRLESPDPKTLTAFTKDGWLNMDDSGFFDQNRNLYVLGRFKDVIMFGSTCVYPGWLEPKIADHPAVEEACVVPVTDPVLFHNICAIVKPVAGSHLSVQELSAFCRSIFLDDRCLEGTPVPKFYLILPDLPQTATGKIDRKLLQKMAEEMFGAR